MKKKILIIDDDAGILEAVKLALETENYEVEDYPNSDCIDRLTPDSIPHMILTDMLLAGSNGGDIIKVLKSQDFTKNIPVIMFSAHPNAAEFAAQYGANGFLEKPFDVEDLTAIIEKHIQ